MKENRNHGFKLRLIFGIILIALAGVVLFSLNKSTPEDLEKAGKVFDVARREDGDTQVVKVTQISSNPVATVDNGKSKLYIIEYLKEDNTYGIIGLEVPADSKLASDLISKNDTLPNNPELVKVTVIDSFRNKKAIEDYDSKFTEVLNDNNLLSGNSQTVYYLSTSESSSSAQGGMYVAIGLSAAGLLFIGLAFLKRKKVNAAYDELYAAYPELNGNLDLMLQNATYADDETRVYIYKNHFFTTLSGLEVYDLTQANRIYHYQINHKRYGITTNRDSYIVFLTDNTSYRNKKTKIQIVNIGEETDNFLQPFFFAAHQEFPNLEVGYEKNRPFYILVKGGFFIQCSFIPVSETLNKPLHFKLSYDILFLLYIPIKGELL